MVDKSVEADAKRFRWLLEGNGYPPCNENEKDRAREIIDQAMKGEW